MTQLSTTMFHFCLTTNRCILYFTSSTFKGLIFLDRMQALSRIAKPVYEPIWSYSKSSESPNSQCQSFMTYETGVYCRDDFLSLHQQLQSIKMAVKHGIFRNKYHIQRCANATYFYIAFICSSYSFRWINAYRTFYYKTNSKPAKFHYSTLNKTTQQVIMRSQ